MESGGGGGAAAAILGIIYLAIGVLMIASTWMIYVKANKPGWAAIIPFYNIIVLLEIVDKPIWWFLLLFVPVANLIIWILLSIALAEKFGQSAGFGIGLMLLPIIFYPILAFGNAQYTG